MSRQMKRAGRLATEAMGKTTSPGKDSTVDHVRLGKRLLQTNVSRLKTDWTELTKAQLDCGWHDGRPTRLLARIASAEAQIGKLQCPDRRLLDSEEFLILTELVQLMKEVQQLNKESRQLIDDTLCDIERQPPPGAPLH